jgi:hypothetical protein
MLFGSFAGAPELLAAVREARARRLPIHDVFTPYPVHGLAEALGDRPSRLGWVTLAGGLAGLLGAVSLQVWCAVIDWPINVGGKPANSALAFLPISFEATILVGGLATAGAFFWRSRLDPLGGPQPPAPGMPGIPGATDDMLVLALIVADEGDGEAARTLLLRAGAREIREVAA